MSLRRSPRVSVLLPVRNGQPYLTAAARSLSEQRFGDFEVIAVDDASADGTSGILARWAEEDSRVRVVSGTGRGIVAALERGREAARGEFLARMDADDLSHPERLALQVAQMDGDPGLVLSGTRIRYFPRSRLRGGALRYEAWLNGLIRHEEMERDLFVECPVAHPTFLLRSTAVEAVGGYRDRGWPEDYDLVLRLWEAGGRFGKVPRVLLRWREGPDRLSRLHPAYTPEAFRRLKAEMLRRTLLRGRRGVVICGAGPTGKAFSRTLTRAGIGLRAFVEVDPRKIGQEIHGAPVVDPSALPDFRDALGLGAVGRDGARAEVRGTFHAYGWREGSDFVLVA